MGRTFALLAVAVCAGCSLMGLDDVNATACATVGENDLSEAHALCARELSDVPLGNCEAPVCAAQVGAELFCVIGTPDEDGDGVGDAACIAEDSEFPRDCDEEDPTVAEGLAELCDGKDNDCDGRVDEGLLVAGEPRRRDVAHSGSNPGDTEGLVASAAAGETVEAAFRRGGTLRVLQDSSPIVPQFDAMDVRLVDPATEATDQGLAIASKETSTFVVFPAAGCRRLQAGWMDGTTLSSVMNLPSMGDNTCGTDPEMRVAERAPAASLEGSDAVIAWFVSDARGACGTGEFAPLRVAASTDGAAFSAGALELGMANNAGAPALLYVPSASVHVIAYGDASNLVVSTLRRRDSLLEVASTTRVDMIKTVQEVALAVGPVDDTATVVGIAASVGCGSNAQVVLQRVSVERGGGDVSPMGNLDVVDEGGEQRQPAVAFGASRPRGFFVLWAEDDLRVRGQLLDAVNGTSGPAFDVMAPMDFDGMTPSRLRGLGVAPITTGGFDTLAHVRHDMPGFYGTTVLCGGE